MVRKSISAISFFLILTLLTPDIVLAVAQSTNFKLYGGQVTPFAEPGSSTNFGLNPGGAVGGGESTSANFSGQFGAPVNNNFSAAAAEAESSSSVTGGGRNTGDPLLAKFENVEIRSISPTQVEVTFDTDITAVTRIAYRVGTDGEIRNTAEEISFLSSHQFQLSPLTPNTSYTFVIYARSLPGDIVQSQVFSFVTDPVIASVVPNLENFRVNRVNGVAELNWRNPTADIDRIIIVRRQDRAANSPADGQTVFSDLAETATDSTVLSNTTYFYTGFLVTNDGQSSTGVVTTLLAENIIPGPAVPGTPPGTTTGDTDDDDDIETETEDDDREITGDDGELASQEPTPAEPPPISPDIEPTPENESLREGEGQIQLFSIIEQNVERTFFETIERIRRVPEQVRERLQGMVDGIVDGFGRISQDAMQELTENERLEIENIIEEELPKIADRDEVVDTRPGLRYRIINDIRRLPGELRWLARRARVTIGDIFRLDRFDFSDEDTQSSQDDDIERVPPRVIVYPEDHASVTRGPRGFVQDLRELPEGLRIQIESLQRELGNGFDFIVGRDQFNILRRDNSDDLPEEAADILEQFESGEIETFSVQFGDDLLETSPPIFSESAVTNAVAVSLESQEAGFDYHVFAGSNSVLTVPATILPKEVAVITATVGTNAYMLTYNSQSQAYQANFTAPEDLGQYEMIIQVIYEDNTFEEIQKVILIDPYGIVFAKERKAWKWSKPWQILFKEDVPIGGAEVRLFRRTRTNEWVVWPAHLYNQYNPILTREDGNYAFVVPPGTYYIAVSHPEYKTYRTPAFVVDDQILNINIELRRQIYLLWRILALIVILGLVSIVIRNNKGKKSKGHSPQTRQTNITHKK